MKVPEGHFFFTEELSAKRTIISGDVSNQGNVTNLVDVVVQQAAGSHANSSPLDEWFTSMKIDGAEPSSTGENQAKIPKIPKMFRDLESNMDDKSYDPLVVSIGPYHHGKPELQEIEKLKIEMAKQYVSDTHAKKGANLNKKIEEVADALYNEVEKVAYEAKNYYDLDSSSAIGDHQSFTKMMFLDGCFILQYIYLSDHGNQDMGMKIHHAAIVQRDLFLLENQLPYIVLKALMSKENEGKIMIDNFIEQNNPALRQPKLWRNPFVLLLNFIIHIFSYIKCTDQAAELPTNGRSSTKDVPPLHLLDMVRKKFVGPNKSSTKVGVNSGPVDWTHSYHSATELTKKGINFMPNQSRCCSDVVFSFSANILFGDVTLPRLIIDGYTKSMLLNMVAFETSPGGPDDGWVTSYICFMDSLINNGEDVTVLRSDETLVNCLSSDQHVADLFNGIAKYLAPNASAYGQVKKSITEHCDNRIKVFIGEFLHTYFSGPWKFLAFVGVLVGLFLTAYQTYTIIKPNPTPPKQ